MSSRSPGSLTTTRMHPNRLAGAGGDAASGVDGLAVTETRRAMIASAMGGIDRFKKSWMSVMLLKSSIGLGQVVVLLTLLILASALDSPLSPHAKQSTPSPACPRPQLFQAWMGVNMARLTICWGTQHEDEERSVETRTHTFMSHSDTVPSLSHSSSSGSSATLAGMSSSSHTTPDISYTSRMDSQLSLDALAQYTMETESRDDKNSLDRPGVITTIPTTTTAMRPAAGSTPTLLKNSQPCAFNDLQAARDLHEGRSPRADNPQSSRAAALLDRWAPTYVKSPSLMRFELRTDHSISKSLGAISAVLFVLGNVMLFYPDPTSDETCYHAAPMLWWGVMTVVGIGWILLAQVFFVIVIVGVGGQAVLTLLRRTGIIRPPPEAEPARPPQPEVLTQAEVDKIRLVVYLPEPHETADEPSPSTDLTRLAHAPMYLPSHKATCAICQEMFEPPREGRTILLQAEPLRLLGCGHVYHAGCIDQWLLEGHGNCPFCNRAVRDSPPKSGRHSLRPHSVGGHPSSAYRA